MDKEIILKANITQPCHCNICGSLGTLELEFGRKYDENNSCTQTIRLCNNCSKKMADLLIKNSNKTNNSISNSSNSVLFSRLKEIDEELNTLFIPVYKSDLLYKEKDEIENEFAKRGLKAYIKHKIGE